MNDRSPSWPKLSSRPVPVPVAAAATGLLVGWAAAGLVWLGMAGCEVWRDSPSCGGGLGFAILVAVVVISWITGRLLLGFVGVSDAWLVSFLGVALAMILVMLFWIDDTFSVWMWLVMPVLTAATFAGSLWLVRASGGDAGDRSEGR